MDSWCSLIKMHSGKGKRSWSTPWINREKNCSEILRGNQMISIEPAHNGKTNQDVNKDLIVTQVVFERIEDQDEPNH